MQFLLRPCTTFAKITLSKFAALSLPLAKNLVSHGHEVSVYPTPESPPIKGITFYTRIKQAEYESDFMFYPNATTPTTIECRELSTFNNKSYFEGRYKLRFYGGEEAAASGNLLILAHSSLKNEALLRVLRCMGRVECSRKHKQTALIAEEGALAAEGIQMAGICEALALGTKLGMDPLILSNIMKVSTSRCVSVGSNNPLNIKGEGGVTVEKMVESLKFVWEEREKGKYSLVEKSKSMYEEIEEKKRRENIGALYYKLIEK